MELKTVRLSNNLTLEYVEQGNATGPVIVCLHGYSDSWKSYQPALPYFPEALHVFALSQRGHGNSDRPAEGFHPEDYAADVARFIDEMRLGAAVIVGHSMGGIIAQRFAIDFPQKTKALVLVCTFSRFKGNENVEAMHKVITAMGDRIDPAFVEEFQRSSVARPADESFMQTVIGESLKVPVRVWKMVLNSLMNVDYTSQLKAVQKPVLLIWGDQDTFAAKSDQERLLQSIAGSRLITYEGAGHSVHWEEPQRFARDVNEFVNEVVQ